MRGRTSQAVLEGFGLAGAIGSEDVGEGITIFDVPLEVARALTGFRRDADDIPQLTRLDWPRPQSVPVRVPTLGMSVRRQTHAHAESRALVRVGCGSKSVHHESLRASPNSTSR